MCWNKDISLNTFIVSFSILVFIYYTNNFTKYKLNEFLNNNIIYLFYLAVISMQLVEYFLWKNINNPYKNKILSIIGLLLIFLQPLLAIIGYTTGAYRSKMLIGYLISCSIYLLYRFFINPNLMKTTVSSKGHLSWEWLKMRGWETIFILLWLFFLFGSVSDRGNIYGIFVPIGLLIISLYFYYRTNTWGSMWCWIVNIVMIFFLVKILIYLPYKEHGLC